MADNNLPVSGTVETPTPPSEATLIENLADLLDDSPPENPVKEPEDKAATPGEEDDPLGLEEDAADVEDDAADEPDGSDDPEVKGGRFAPDTAKVRLEDGKTITVAELKRNNLYHAGFTQKTQELSKERETFDNERKGWTEYAQSLNQTRDYFEWYATTAGIPKDPGPFTGAADDYVGYQGWQKEKEAWQNHVQAYQAFQYFKEQEQQRKQGETVSEANKRLKDEQAKLLVAIPVLKDPVKGRVVWSNIVSGAQKHYGLTEQEVNSVSDHRMLKVLRDGLAYQQLRSKAPEVKAEAVKRPVNPGRRQQPQAAFKKAADGRLEQLKRKPSLENGVASLMDFDL